MRQLIATLFARRPPHRQTTPETLSISQWADLPAYHPACPEPRCAQG